MSLPAGHEGEGYYLEWKLRLEEWQGLNQEPI